MEKNLLFKKIIVFSMVACTSLNGFAQKKTATMENYYRKLATDKKFATERAEYERTLNNWIENNKNSRSLLQTTITIPVVIHIVYKTAAQNASNANAISQIDVLNEDYNRTNADTNNTPAVWRTIAAKTGIQFCLAQRDPNGNPTTGIERRLTTVTSFGTNDMVKSYAQGGMDAWDPSKYLNIWCCNIGGGILGYGEFPSTTLSNTYGLVIQYDAFGRIGLTGPYNLGRTSTHEIGHCFNLFHIWGDDSGACSGSDLVGDTPNQGDATYGCKTFPALDACATASPGYMFMNYMDYTDDNCMNTFTQGQSVRMLAVVNNPPYNTLKTSNGCQPVTLQNNDAGILAVISPKNSFCTNTITPSVTIKNFGSSTLTSAVINYKVDMNTVQTYAYSGSLASLATATVTLPNITVASGAHTFTTYTTLPNGSTDGNNTNDTATSSFVVNSGTGAALPYTEGFESTTFPTNGITITNADAATTWARTTVAKKTGLASAFMDDFNYNAAGEIDEMILPSLNLASVSNPELSFQLAYRLYTAPTAVPSYSDTLELLISSDCGTTWTQIYKKFSTALTTATPSYSTVSFVPTAAQWRKETISLGSYATVNNAIVKFKHTTGYENQLYVDDININSSVAASIQESDISNLINVYPNPANESFTINLGDNLSAKDALVTITDQLGREIKTKHNVTQNTIGIPTTNIANGTYFVKINIHDTITVKKIVITH